MLFTRRSSTAAVAWSLALATSAVAADFGGAPHAAAPAPAPAATGIGVQVGGMLVIAPKYEGAKEYELVGFPIVAPSGFGIGDDGYVQFRGVDDLRLRLLRFNGFEAGPLVGWRFDRDEDDARRLNGLGDVDGGLVVGGYAGYRAGPFMPFVSYHHQVTGDETGGLVRFGAEAKLTPWRGVAVTGTVGASYADDDYMDAYFSVTNAQFATSGLGPYDADAGVKDVFIGVTSDIPVWQDWTLKLSGRYSLLVGDAADSPIVENENQFYGGIGLTYRFGLNR